ncbi:MAG: DUF4922 domain-containing protein [Bacteroidaceae bacterium]
MKKLVTSAQVLELINQQLSTWELARNNYDALKTVKEKELNIDGCTVKVQFNPARLVSSAAKVDAKSIKERKCFLCKANLPEVQKSIPFGDYLILVNPFPIFPKHLTIPAREHIDQHLLHRFGDMLDLAYCLDEFTLFYNGPKCGASAPDHAHFQAGNKGFLPIEKEWRLQKKEKVSTHQTAQLFALKDYSRSTLIIESEIKEDAVYLFQQVYAKLDKKSGEEPMMNVLAWYEQPKEEIIGKWIVCIFPRAKHRPACYTAEGDDNILISPASVDMGGVFITPQQKDFEKITAKDISTIYQEVCVDKLAFDEPDVSVGILSGSHIEFAFQGDYLQGKESVAGKQCAEYSKGMILWQGQSYSELLFAPKDFSNSSFELIDVTIGLHFHWERKENQRFRGALKLIVEEGQLTAINLISVEDYLISVISSEMSANASIELLKAHTVISRSWLLAQMQKSKESAKSGSAGLASQGDDSVRWYDREDHLHFDVCADDHCQRYQGITRLSNPNVEKAVRTTHGLVLDYDGAICDARFSKCCGGETEEFQNCWEDVKYPYLTTLRDDDKDTQTHNLSKEENAEKWILTAPSSFCNTTDAKILSQVLNNYDQETANFYRWEVNYKQQELSELIAERSGVDYGQIVDLIPVERGASGRLVKLMIVGTKQTGIVGKELEIRRILSSSHLYSSAFVVRKEGSMGNKGVPKEFKLIGAGWGHGVGLCQIGAAVMGERGYTYDAILTHYYRGATIKKIY